jgi:parallel beta-helix repeat protein
MQQNAASLLDGSPFAVAILVSGTTGVSINGLIVDGANNGLSQCAPRLFGIAFQNASGEISHVAIRNFKLGTALGGCQSGTGIFVQSAGSGASNIEIDNSTIHDFQKNGITANEAGTVVSVHDNVVTGIGPTSGAAQNGIQIGFGAGGSISANTVTNNVWSPCTSADTCQAVATNILVTQSDGVQVSNNRVGISQVGIFLHGNQGLVTGNATFATAVFDGIRLEGDSNRVRQNEVFNGAESGIFVSGNNNVIQQNTITEASVGILKQTGSLGNLIRLNDIFDALVSVQDPASTRLAGVVSPER